MDYQNYRGLAIWKPTGEEITIIGQDYDQNNYVYCYKAIFKDGSTDWVPEEEVDFIELVVHCRSNYELKTE